MGLLDKKKCDICGKEIGLLGNRKLENGNMCKDCASKLSPWFRGRKKTTVKDIKEQLAYREANKAKVKEFKTNVTYGGKTKIHVDKSSNRFIVTSSDNWRERNPDVIELTQLRACDIKVIESRTEMKRKLPDGSYEHFDPPRYTFEYEFDAILAIDSPYFDTITVELTEKDDRPTEKDSSSYNLWVQEGKRIQEELKSGQFIYTSASGSSKYEDNEDIDDDDDDTLDGEWTCECGQVNDSNFCSACGKPRADKWYCPDCGQANSGAFCTSCGRKKPTD